MRKNAKDPNPSGFKRKSNSRNFSKNKTSPNPSSNGRKREDNSDLKRKGKYAGRKEKSGNMPEYDFKKINALQNVKAPPEKVVAKAKEDDGRIRLNKFISNSGVCSRREADKLIEAGEIKVNGNVITELGYKVNKGDHVKYGNKTLRREKMVYVLLNKPKDFITTTNDPENRRTVMQLVANACEERIYPVGRLDRNTTGLIILTNDGDLAKKLSHPSYKVKKLYQADLDKPLKDEDFLKIQEGVVLEDGLAKVDEVAIVSPDAKSIGLEIHIGRNRIVRRIFEHLGYEVVRLDRVMYAGLTKLDLPRGNWRYLSEKEVIKLKFLK